MNTCEINDTEISNVCFAENSEEQNNKSLAAFKVKTKKVTWLLDEIFTSYYHRDTDHNYVSYTLTTSSQHHIVKQPFSVGFYLSYSPILSSNRKLPDVFDYHIEYYFKCPIFKQYMCLFLFFFVEKSSLHYSLFHPYTIFSFFLQVWSFYQTLNTNKNDPIKSK